MSQHVHMTEHNRDPLADRDLLGKILRREIIREHSTIADFVKGAKVSRKTVERIMNGDPTITREPIEYVEGRLGLPRDTLALIAAHDIQGLREIGVEADLIRSVVQEMANKSDDMGGMSYRQATVQ